MRTYLPLKGKWIIKNYRLLCSWVLLACMALLQPAAAQYVPVNIASGFNQDGIAESGTSTMAATTVGLDLQQKVLYSRSFATANGITLGVVDNGTITSGSDTWQLQPYNQNNCLFMSGAGVTGSTSTGLLTLQTPAAFAKISLLGFSTEQNATYQVTLGFSDGTTVNMGNITFMDWFFNTPFVIQGLGRIIRQSAGPYTVDGYTGTTPSDPRFYRVNLNIPCASQSKLLQTVRFSFVSATGTATRTAIFAVSGIAYAPVGITGPVITNATCGTNNGSVAYTVTGGATPLTYSWNTSPVQTTPSATGLSAGTYTLTVRDANGCTTSPAPATVGQTAPGGTFSASATPSSICAGEPTTLTATYTGGTASNYVWTPGNLTGQTVTATPAASGSNTYTVTAQDASGCTLTASTTVTVKPTPANTFTPNAAVNVCAGTGITVTYTGSAPAAALYEWNFDGATILSGSQQGPYTISYANTTGNNVVKNITLKVTQDGCASAVSAPVAVTVSAPPSADFILNTNSICEGGSVTATYNATPSSTAVPTWSFGSGTATGSGFGPYNITYNTANTEQITLTVKDGTDAACVATVQKPVTVKLQPTATFNPPSASICEGTPLTVTYTGNAPASASYNWFGFDGATVLSGSQQGPYSIAYNGTSGTKNLTLQVSLNGCTSAVSSPHPVTVTAKPSTDFTVFPNNICSGDAVTIHYTGTPSSTASYTWNFDGGNPGTGTGSADHQVVYNNSASGITLTVSDGACVAVTSTPIPAQAVTVTQKPQAGFTADLANGCTDGINGFTTGFTNTTTNATTGVTTYTWNYGEGAPEINSGNGSHAYILPATYNVTLTAQTGSCSTSFGPVVINVLRQPVAAFFATPGLNVPTQISQADFQFTNQSSNASRYSWNFGDGSLPSGVTDPLHKYEAVGNYSVSLIAANGIGCADTLTLDYMVVIPDSTLKIPNAFSPNFDGVHDTWIIQGLKGYPKATVKVFNRWGQEVFSSIGYNTPFDGKFKGERLPNGTYYYLIVANSIKYAGWLYISY